jgi:hypothetical protein
LRRRWVPGKADPRGEVIEIVVIPAGTPLDGKISQVRGGVDEGGLVYRALKAAGFRGHAGELIAQTEIQHETGMDSPIVLKEVAEFTELVGAHAWGAGRLELLQVTVEGLGYQAHAA